MHYIVSSGACGKTISPKAVGLPTGALWRGVYFYEEEESDEWLQYGNKAWTGNIS